MNSLPVKTVLKLQSSPSASLVPLRKRDNLGIVKAGEFFALRVAIGWLCQRLQCNLPPLRSSLGKMKDGGTITVVDQATCDVIRSAKDYNSNVAITVE